METETGESITMNILLTRYAGLYGNANQALYAFKKVATQDAWADLKFAAGRLSGHRYAFKIVTNDERFLTYKSFEAYLELERKAEEFRTNFDLLDRLEH